MFTKIVHSKSIRAILSYNELKVRNQEAELLLAAGYLQDPGQLSFAGKLGRFETLTRQNERTHTNAMHIILSFSAQDKLDNDLLQSIALRYMEGIGFGGQPFLLYRHYDTHNPHIHIATVNIAPGGQRIETHNIGRNQSEATRKFLEELYGLVKAEDQKKDEHYMLRPADLKKAVYGKYETKATISAIVRQVTDTYKFTSLPELNAILRQFNVMAYTGAENTRMYEKGGLAYCITDEEAMPVSIPIKASSIFGSPTLKNLEKKYGPNSTERKPYGERLKHLLNKAIEKAKAQDDILRALARHGIRVLLRLNEQGQVYGATFIDNATRSVFNGSDLGKQFSAKAFMERLGQKGISKDSIAAAVQSQPQAADADIPKADGEDKASFPAIERPVIELVKENNDAQRLDGKATARFQRQKRKMGLE